jgi:hypothetical protein
MNPKGERRLPLIPFAKADASPDPGIVQQAVGQLPWGHNIVLLTRLTSSVRRVRETRIYDTRPPGKTRL